MSEQSDTFYDFNLLDAEHLHQQTFAPDHLQAGLTLSSDSQNNQANLLVNEAWSNYSDLVNALRRSIHLEDESVDIVIQSLFKIGGIWAQFSLSEPEIQDSVRFRSLLPFADQTQIDMVRTLLGIAAYSENDSSFSELQIAFDSIIKMIQESLSNRVAIANQKNVA